LPVGAWRWRMIWTYIMKYIWEYITVRWRSNPCKWHLL
jgi:hypothetical protein